MADRTDAVPLQPLDHSVINRSLSDTEAGLRVPENQCIVESDDGAKESLSMESRVKRAAFTDGWGGESQDDGFDHELQDHLMPVSKNWLNCCFLPDDESLTEEYKVKRNESFAAACQTCMAGLIITLAMLILTQWMQNDQYYNSTVKKYCDLQMNETMMFINMTELKEHQGDADYEERLQEFLKVLPYALAWPRSVSKAIHDESSILGILVSLMLYLAGYMLLRSELGKPSVFPHAVGLMETVFNFFRWFLPFVTCIAIPMLPMLTTQENWGQEMQGSLHGIFAVVGFFGALILELIASVLLAVRFFGTTPYGFYYKLFGKVRWLWLTLLVLRILAVIWGVVCAINMQMLHSSTQSFDDHFGDTITAAYWRMQIFFNETYLIVWLGYLYLMLGVMQIQQGGKRNSIAFNLIGWVLATAIVGFYIYNFVFTCMIWNWAYGYFPFFLSSFVGRPDPCAP